MNTMQAKLEAGEAKKAAQKIIAGENPDFIWQLEEQYLGYKGYSLLKLDTSKPLVTDVKNEDLVKALEGVVSSGAYTLREQAASGAFLISHPTANPDVITIRLRPDYQEYLKEEYLKTQARGSSL